MEEINGKKVSSASNGHHYSVKKRGDITLVPYQSPLLMLRIVFYVQWETPHSVHRKAKRHRNVLDGVQSWEICGQQCGNRASAMSQSRER